MSLVKTFEFATTEEAWAKLNKYFLTEEDEVVARGGVRYGTKLASHNLFMKIRTAYINPEFDFAYMFGYKKAKWSKLISNYVDLNYLDLVKAEVLSRESKKQSEYNVSFIFDNAHSSGHGCLVNLTFIRRPKNLYPILQFSLRSSEITKRLIFDFLLIQRMGEYVFGKDQHLAVEVFLPNTYTTCEGLVMMDNYFSLDKLFAKAEDNGGLKPFQARTKGILDKFRTIHVDEVTYKVHKRSVKQLQKVNGVPISNSPELKVKNLNIY